MSDVTWTAISDLLPFPYVQKQLFYGLQTDFRLLLTRAELTLKTETLPWTMAWLNSL